MTHDDVTTAPPTVGAPDPGAADPRADGGIDLTEEPGRSVVRLWGEVDAGLRDRASSAMVRCIQRGLPVVVDVGDVTFIDSSGLAFILQLHRVGADEGMTLVLRDAPALVTDLLDMIGMSGVIEVEAARPAPERPTNDGGRPTLAPV